MTEKIIWFYIHPVVFYGFGEEQNAYMSALQQDNEAIQLRIQNMLGMSTLWV